MTSVIISNDGTAPLCVLTEPLAEDFWILPGEMLTFDVPDEKPLVSFYDDGASVWVNEGNPVDVVVTTNAGVVVKCGYQRPAGAFAPPS